MLVGSFVLSMFIMLALGAIVPSYKVVREAEDSLSAQREVIMAFDRLVAEMSNLDRASVTAVPGALSFLSDKDYRGSNALIADTNLDFMGLASPDHTWRKWVILRQRNNELWRREQPYDKGSDLWQILPGQLPIVADAPVRQEKIFAKNVELFEASVAGRGRVLLKIRSVFRQSAKPAACELNLQIQMRGGGQ